jgi:hypothetical protein
MRTQLRQSGALPLQTRFATPRRANARRSCFRARRVYPNVCGIGVAGAFPEHHGGLTPAALFRGCVCASQKSFFRWRTSASQYKSGGRKPPVGTLHASTTTENHGKPALVQESALRGTAERECNGDPHTHRRQSAEQARLCLRKRVSHIHGGLTPAAPGRMCVCASHKSLFHRRAFASQYKSGGRKPPWVRCRYCTGVREHAAGGLSRLCGGAFAIALR